MQIKKYENSNLTINLKVDKLRWVKFIKDLKKLGQKAEFDSNPNYLNYFISTHFQKTPHVGIGGICSRVIESSGEIFEVVFLDVDNQMRFLLESECKFLMKEYNLSPFYLWTTSEKLDEISKQPKGNYHAISVTKCHYKKILEMQSKVHTLDPAYSVIPRIFAWKTWVLRQSNKKNRPKPKFVKIIGDSTLIYRQNCSNAHREFIEGVYPEIPKVKYANLDKHKIDRLFLTSYHTASNIKGEKN